MQCYPTEGQKGSPGAAASTHSHLASPGILQRLRLLQAEFLIPSNFTSEHCVHRLVPMPENGTFTSALLGTRTGRVSSVTITSPACPRMRFMGTLHLQLPKAERGNGPGVVILSRAP